MNKLPTQNEPSVKDFLALFTDDRIIKDTKILMDMMERISGHQPKMWNVGTLGYDKYHFKYDSGREGENFIIGFYPRKAKNTIYLMDGTAKYSKQLEGLGTHTITGYCIYIKQLSDIDITVLEQILQQSFDYIKTESSKGPIDRILWKDNAPS